MILQVIVNSKWDFLKQFTIKKGEKNGKMFFFFFFNYFIFPLFYIRNPVPGFGLFHPFQSAGMQFFVFYLEYLVSHPLFTVSMFCSLAGFHTAASLLL